MDRLLWTVMLAAPLAMAPTCNADRRPETPTPTAESPAPRGEKPIPGYGCRTYVCPGHDAPFECGDCVDNDGDGQVDYGWDQNCTGACDDDEAGLDTLVPGSSTVGCRVECYFDGGVGGAEECTYDLRCDPLEPRAIEGGRTRFESCEYVGDEAFASEQLWGSSTCEDLEGALDDASSGESCSTSCGAMTPPGCDCFGCCELPVRSGNFVYLGSRNRDGDATCTYEAAVAEFEETGGDVGAEDRACRLCTPAATCQTPCEEGDRCFGETIPPVCILPEPPMPPGSNPLSTCPAGSTASCVDHSSCGHDEICILDCCTVVIPL